VTSSRGSSLLHDVDGYLSYFEADRYERVRTEMLRLPADVSAASSIDREPRLAATVGTQITQVDRGVRTIDDLFSLREPLLVHRYSQA
jgi:hypothetical protein